MKPKYSTLVPYVTIIVLAFSLLSSCTALRTKVEKSNLDNSPLVRWVPSQNGLTLGIEQPVSPFVFEPVKDWSGPLIIHERDSSGRLTGMRSNAGGQWWESAVLKVYLKNTSENAIIWSKDRDVWHVSFSGSDSAKPVPWPFPGPPPKRNGPIRLGPGDQSRMQFRVAQAGDIWPIVPPDAYTFMVTYSPSRLLNIARGYDVPGFWKGVIATPIITVEVVHPTIAYNDREGFACH